ncbi:MAG: RNA methyltransferase [Gemmatimonadales bacterium]|jgi:TrmH family RNA methyltransferase
MAGNLHTLLRDLQRRKARERRGFVVAEGRRLVMDALECGVNVKALLIAEDSTGALESVLQAATRRGVPVESAPRRAFNLLADTETPSGVLAVVEWRPKTLADLALEPHATLLVLDAVQDPGNVGGMIRTAYALGAAATVALDGTADPGAHKVLRAAMGAAFRHPVVEARWAEFAAFAQVNGVAIWAACQGGEPPAHARPDRLALVVGNEGAGLRPEVLAAAARQVGVPMQPGAESLNAATAAAILLYEVTRGRR